MAVRQVARALTAERGGISDLPRRTHGPAIDRYERRARGRSSAHPAPVPSISPPREVPAPALTPPKLFGTDGIRGHVDEEPMTASTLMKVGRAIAARIKAAHAAGGPKPRIVIARDTRSSGPAIERALAAGIHSMGVDTLHAGVLPTAAIGLLIQDLGLDGGIEVSASHNPPAFNGVKVFGADGFKLSDAAQEEIEAGVARPPRPKTAKGRAKPFPGAGARERYEAFLLSTIPPGIRFDGLKIVVDCANGAAFEIAPAVLRKLGATVVELGAHPDGGNINESAGSEHAHLMAKAVRAHHADLGFAFDGDSDRIVVADEHGKILDGDHLLAISARELKAHGALAGDAIVATVMSNLGLERSLEEIGVRVIRTGVGDRLVTEALRDHALSLGGEQNGHIMFTAFGASEDGILTGLQILSALVEKRTKMSALANVMSPVPQILVNVPVKERVPLESLPGVQAAIREAEAELAGKGRILVRWSGTEPVLRVMVEGPDEAEIRRLAERVTSSAPRSSPAAPRP